MAVASIILALGFAATALLIGGGSTSVDEAAKLSQTTARCRLILEPYLRYAHANFNQAVRSLLLDEEQPYESTVGASFAVPAMRMAASSLNQALALNSECSTPELRAFAEEVDTLAHGSQFTAGAVQALASKGEAAGKSVELPLAFPLDGLYPGWQSDAVPRPQGVQGRVMPDDSDAVVAVLKVLNSSP